MELKEQLFPKAIGCGELKKHYKGKILTQRKAILAKCYDCMGCYIDGKIDCKVITCPLYRWMPYKDEVKNAP
jgi:hypothetical protein